MIWPVRLHLKPNMASSKAFDYCKLHYNGTVRRKWRILTILVHNIGFLMLKFFLQFGAHVRRNIALRTSGNEAKRKEIFSLSIHCTLVQGMVDRIAQLFKLASRFIGRKKKTKLHGLSPRATAACRRSDCQLFADTGCHVVSVTNPYGRILGFLDRSRYFSFK
jgi:hypothetical protein